jgi:hypothetical protein
VNVREEMIKAIERAQARGELTPVRADDMRSALDAALLEMAWEEPSDSGGPS